MSRSPYFKTSLNTAVGENNKVFSVEECSPRVLTTVIDFMYGIDIPEQILDEDAEMVLAMADLYLMEDLKEAVALHLGKDLAAGKILERSTLAEKYGAEKLKEMCCDFILSNMKEINKEPRDHLVQILHPLLGKKALEKLDNLEDANTQLYANVRVANDLLGFNLSTFKPYKKRADYQSLAEYETYVRSNIKPNMVVGCNNELGTWAHVAGGEERTFGWVLSCDAAGPVVKWPLHGKKGSTAMRGSYQDLDILTPPTNSPIFKL